jgi:protein-tyrosine phosphatase
MEIPVPLDQLAEPSRVLELQGVHNFRDYGGYAATGGRLKRALLFRSAQHHGATDSDLDSIAALGLATVIDLRGGGERAAAPCRRPAGFAAQVFFVDEDTAGLAPHVEAAKSAPGPDEARQGMIRGYAEMPFRTRMIPILARYFEALETHEGPSLIHCMAGKDRTGLAVALFHAMLGVHHDDIVADYMLTNVAGRVDQRIAAGARHIRSAYGEEIRDDAIRVLMTVDPAYIDSAFTAIRERHGSTEAYLRDVLGVSEARREKIAERMVE